MEFDVLLTKDYVPVIYHDFTICLSTATKVSIHLMPLLFHILHCTLFPLFSTTFVGKFDLFQSQSFLGELFGGGGGGGGGGMIKLKFVNIYDTAHRYYSVRKKKRKLKKEKGIHSVYMYV